MNKISNILVIIDQGCLRQPALDRALALYSILKKSSQKCVLQAVMPIKKELFSLTKLLAVDSESLEKSVITKQERWLKAFLQVNAMDMNIESRVIYSKDPAYDISCYARQIGASLIVKSNEVHGFLDTILSRSLDIEVLRRASVPVLIAKSSIFRTERIIAVAVDLSDPDNLSVQRMNLRLLREAQILSKLTGAQIALVNAITPVTPPVVVDIPSYTPDAVYGPSVETRCQIAMDFARRHNIDRRHCIICEGFLTDVIYDVCLKLRPSVLFMGSQARSGLSSMLIGNISEKLADLIDCDIAVITADTALANTNDKITFGDENAE